MPGDLWSLYALMLKSRLFEEAEAGIIGQDILARAPKGGEKPSGKQNPAIGPKIVVPHFSASPLSPRSFFPISLFSRLIDLVTGISLGHTRVHSKWLTQPQAPAG